MTAPVEIRLGGELVRLSGDGKLTGRAAELGDASASANTLRAYHGHLRRLEAWCREAVQEPVSPWEASNVSAFLADCIDLREYGAVALRQAAAAIRMAYQATGRTAAPEWTALIKGALKTIVKTHKGRGPAEPLRLDDLKDAARALYRARQGYVKVGAASDPRAAVFARDRALLLIGYLGGFRRSELTALDVDDVTASLDGLEIAIRGSKTAATEITSAQILAGRDGPPTCPLAAWTDWMQARPARLALEKTHEPAWLSATRTGQITTARLGGDRSVERILKRALELAGIDGEPYSAHSLRAGLATELAEHGIGLQQIANAGRWSRVDTVLRYARRARRWTDSPLHGLPY